MRDKIGSFMSRADCERFLNTWISSYVTPDDTARPEAKAQFPLREARIDVVDVPGKPGLLQGGGLPPAALPARRADRLAPAGGRAAAAGAGADGAARPADERRAGPARRRHPPRRRSRKDCRVSVRPFDASRPTPGLPGDDADGSC